MSQPSTYPSVLLLDDRHAPACRSGSFEGMLSYQRVCCRQPMTWGGHTRQGGIMQVKGLPSCHLCLPGRRLQELAQCVLACLFSRSPHSNLSSSPSQKSINAAINDWNSVRTWAEHEDHIYRTGSCCDWVAQETDSTLTSSSTKLSKSFSLSVPCSRPATLKGLRELMSCPFTLKISSPCLIPAPSAAPPLIIPNTQTPPCMNTGMPSSGGAGLHPCYNG